MSELYRVLVVDDELLVRQGVKHILNWEQHGFCIVGEASNGKEALEMIAELSPHIVLTDVVMPVMDGEELTRLIKHSWPDIEVIVLSSFSEFDYVRSTFQSGVSDYILKPHLETKMLLSVLERTVERLPAGLKRKPQADYTITLNQVLEKLIDRYEVEIDQTMLAEWFPYQKYYIMGTAVDEGEQLLESLQALISEMTLYPLPVNSIPRHPELRTYVVNIGQNAEAENILLSKLKLLYPSSVTDSGDFVWALSGPFHSLDQLGGTFHRSFLPLLSYRFFLPVPMVLAPSELPHFEKVIRASASLNDTALHALMEHIRRLQLEEGFGVLYQFIAQQSKSYNTDVFEFKSLIGNLIFNVIQLLGTMNMSSDALNEAKYSYFKAIEEAGHVTDIITLLEQFRTQIDRSIHEATSSFHDGNPNMKLLLDYIDKNYTEPITLTEMAKQFHFNPSYLSSFFAAHHHEGFKEHLNRVRIDKAADLLRGSDHSISEIGSMVGYADHSYFCKVFKKNTGISPSQYRRQYYTRVEKEQG
ncbi:response regulator transcription factor [Paenibacillus agri]|uniref:Response regulator transcription factor n=1 Tax=Paenibacillus agri TaxID=2744309 RepID=A0A850EHQ2_9BACL|nr:response regulator transcription factor [Paenibacillus agri]NUU59400.1 response regulator transcription factor [Paenibacillus agri]